MDDYTYIATIIIVTEFAKATIYTQETQNK